MLYTTYTEYVTYNSSITSDPRKTAPKKSHPNPPVLHENMLASCKAIEPT